VRLAIKKMEQQPDRAFARPIADGSRHLIARHLSIRSQCRSSIAGLHHAGYRVGWVGMKRNSTPPPEITAVRITGKRLTFMLEDGRTVTCRWLSTRR
jgi:hypothetical protein